ncbi:MAG TPA: GerMN domain-containing protein [Actinomycetes bacterium]|nr:GerMN domain-containing protein [Actinomycetes bacterium]
MTRQRLISSVTGAVVLIAALSLLPSACAGDRGPSGSRRQIATLVALPESARRADEVPGRRQAVGRLRPDVTVYYLRTVRTVRYLAPEEHAVARPPSVSELAEAAVTELLTGRPRYLGTERPFPDGTRLLGLRLTGGTATVNLSRRALGAASPDGYPLQALVWTVTELPSVKRVVVQVEGRTSGSLAGRPVAALLGVGTGGRQLVRDRSLRLAPIVLDEPSPEAAVAGDRVVARGGARAAGGTVGLRLRDGTGRVVSQGFATLAASPPAWGRFSGALAFTPPPRPQLWRIEVFEASPVDASVTYSVVVPVWVGR